MFAFNFPSLFLFTLITLSFVEGKHSYVLRAELLHSQGLSPSKDVSVVPARPDLTFLKARDRGSCVPTREVAFEDGPGPARLVPTVVD